jgi:indolepyruvate ferredoxin oxidoreductase, beta subunit
MKEFNVIVTGVGGQGVLTLGIIIAEAAVKQGFDTRTIELHGLAQRGGTIPVHIRFGEKIYAPLVREGNADLIIGLEPIEALRAANFGSKTQKTVFVFDDHRIVPSSISLNDEEYPSNEGIKIGLKGFSEKVIFMDASEIVKVETGSTIAANIFLLGYIVANGYLPISEENILKAMKEIVPEKHYEMNRKIYEMGKNYSIKA